MQKKAKAWLDVEEGWKGDGSFDKIIQFKITGKEVVGENFVI